MTPTPGRAGSAGAAGLSWRAMDSSPQKEPVMDHFTKKSLTITESKGFDFNPALAPGRQDPSRQGSPFLPKTTC